MAHETPSAPELEILRTEMVDEGDTIISVQRAHNPNDGFLFFEILNFIDDDVVYEDRYAFISLNDAIRLRDKLTEVIEESGVEQEQTEFEKLISKYK